MKRNLEAEKFTFLSRFAKKPPAFPKGEGEPPKAVDEAAFPSGEGGAKRRMRLPSPLGKVARSAG